MGIHLIAKGEFKRYLLGRVLQSALYFATFPSLCRTDGPI